MSTSYKVNYTDPTRAVSNPNENTHRIFEDHLFRDFQFVTQHFDLMPIGATDEMQYELIKDNHIHLLYQDYMFYPKNSIPVQYSFSGISLIECLYDKYPAEEIAKYSYMTPFFSALMRKKEVLDEFLTKAKETNKYVKVHIVVHEQIKQKYDPSKIASLKELATETILCNLHQPGDLGLPEKVHSKTRPSSLPYTPTKDISDVKKVQIGIIYQSPVAAEKDQVEKNLTAKLKDYWKELKNTFGRVDLLNVTLSFSLENSKD